MRLLEFPQRMENSNGWFRTVWTVVAAIVTAGVLAGAAGLVRTLSNESRLEMMETRQAGLEVRQADVRERLPAIESELTHLREGQAEILRLLRERR